MRARRCRGSAPTASFLRALNALADKVGVKIDYITPWNEPNHPAFLQPAARAAATRRSKAIAPLAYAKLVRAAERELRSGQTLVLGSLAGLQRPRIYGAGAAEFIRGLPRDVACLDAPFAQHAYVGEPGRRRRARRRAPNPASARAPRPARRRHRGARRQGLSDSSSSCGSPRPARSTTAARRCPPRCARGRSTTASTRRSSTRSASRATIPVGLVSPSLRTPTRSYRAWFAFAGGPREGADEPC